MKLTLSGKLKMINMIDRKSTLKQVSALNWTCQTAIVCSPDPHKTASQWIQPQHTFSHKETQLTKNQHRHTHTVAQRGIALTLAHTDPLAQPELLRNQRSQGERLWSLPASVKLPLGNLRPASPMSGLYPCMHTSKEKVGITDYTSPGSLLTR